MHMSDAGRNGLVPAAAGRIADYKSNFELDSHIFIYFRDFEVSYNVYQQFIIYYVKFLCLFVFPTRPGLVVSLAPFLNSASQFRSIDCQCQYIINQLLYY